MNLHLISLLLFLVASDCQTTQPKGVVVAQEKPQLPIETSVSVAPKDTKPTVGAEQILFFLPSLQGKKVALVVNQTSLIGETHLADSLTALGIDVVKIFAPEHGFRGEASAGETIKDGKDAKTGIPLISLYGKRKKPTSEDLEGIDVLVFDIQDVGARFYTYISTLFYVMEACADHQKKLIILDRPNPNGHYMDGPSLKPGFESFVGIAPIPLVHGCTIGELAKVFAGEKWLKTNISLDFTVIPCLNYTHDTPYQLPVKPSPNLPNATAVYLYPSLCLFEGTMMSVGRGTDFPFQTVGHPDYPIDDFSFVPKSNDGAKTPLFEGKKCKGVDYSNINIEDLRKEKRLNLGYLFHFYEKMKDKKSFFLANNFFDKLAGSDELRKQILNGESEANIRKSWQKDLENFQAIRAKYVLYP
jgi:uncharacterized protein YbbC (DUF1343 family)